MNYQTLIGRITEYMHLSTTGLSNWLAKKLPDSLGEDWWRLGVISKLSYHQQEIVNENNIETLDELDLSALLRITDKNWYSIRNRFYLRQADRVIIQKMFTVRNNWAHAPSIPPELEMIVSDLKALEDFLGFVEIEFAKLMEFGHLINDISSKGIPDAEPIVPKPNSIIENVPPASEITTNTIVHLASDKNKVGMVVDVEKVGNTIKYTVFVDGRTREFFEGQIEVDESSKPSDLKSVAEVQRMLTAHQIRKPSSSTLYSFNSARIDFVPYQFRPALKLIKSDLPRLLIADGVGVGKTIEAGLILKEMQARTTLDSIVIICPRPLVVERKWEMEMKRFDEDFTAVDGEILRHIISEYDRDGELPDKYRRLIIPYSLLTEEYILGKTDNRKRTRKGLSNLDPLPFFDMVIVDEAHHARNTNTQRYEGVKFFCENSNIAVFLTATPVQMGNNDLFTLLNLLHPETVIDKAVFASMAEPNVYINEAVRCLRVPNQVGDALLALNSVVETDWGRNVVGNNPLYKRALHMLSKGEITREERVKLIHDIESLHSFASMINRTRRQDIEDFCIRRTDTLRSVFTERQQELHDALIEFISVVMATMHPTIPLKFLICTIRRQAASCIFGLAPFIQSIINRGLEQFVMDDYDNQDILEKADLSGIDFFELAERVISLAENLPAEDYKFDTLADIIYKKQEHENNKIIIFTTFRHTIYYLNKKINQLSGIRAAYIDGSVIDEHRRDLRSRFELPKSNPNALDVLLFTEVGSEGLDYQFCDSLVNYDLPWNPMRIEQRIGRIDRRGQKSEVAHIYNCITKGTIDEEIYDRCLSRIGVFEQSIGDCSEILGSIANSITEIVLDSNLTEEERAMKLEQLADNEIRLIQETRRLEEDEKQIFGLDISGYTDELQKAENPWLSPEALRRMVSAYLKSKLDLDNTKISDNKIRLTQEEKLLLFDDYKRLGYISQDTAWARFLRSSSKVFTLAYDQEMAKDTKTIFVTPIHPLAQQAAMYFFSDRPFTTVIEIEISGSEIAPGKYQFQFYIWEYTGDKPQTQLVPICDDKNVQNELAAIIQNAASSESHYDYDETQWDKLAEEHLTLWQFEREKHQNEARLSCLYKAESLAKSINALKAAAQNQINSTNDERIIKMRRGEIERHDIRFAKRKQKLEDEAKHADIHTMLLVNGVLVVKEV